MPQVTLPRDQGPVATAMICRYPFRDLITMDPNVLAAMARWPDVPAVYGWLSISESGHWRLHPNGDALAQPQSQGEPITSPQILAFMARNYAADEKGQWFFQNGPQRVYVRLDAAPYVAHLTTDTATGALKLRTHTGLDFTAIHSLYLDERGRLFVMGDRGPALLAGRDVSSLLEAIELSDAGMAQLETGKSVQVHARGILGFPASPLPLHPRKHAQLEGELGFCQHPTPEAAPRPES